jgi:amino acid adenylation domain-containing protein
VTTVEPPATRDELLRRRLRQARRRDSGIGRRAPEDPLPLSFSQEQLWFMDQFAPGSAAYGIPFAVRLTGPLDVGALQDALDAVVARQEALRMRFASSGDGSPRLVVTETGRLPLAVVEAPREGSVAEREAFARTALADVARAPFDLVNGPLARAAAVRLDEDDHVLLVVLHHIVSDGWSIEVFLGDLFSAYRLILAGAATPGEPEIRYGDFVAWHRATYTGDRLEAELGFWRDHLTGVEPLDLPLDRPRPAEQTFRGGVVDVTLDSGLAAGVAALARRFRVTPYMTYLAAFQTLLFRYSGQDDFAVGTAVAGRARQELEGLVGLFANLLALRADLTGDPTFADLLRRVRRTTLDALSHSGTPFEAVVRDLRLPRDPSRAPVFQTTFTMMNYVQRSVGLDGVTIGPFPLDTGATRFDLELYLYDATDTGQSGFFTYNSDLFDRATVERAARHLTGLLRAVVADPDRPVSRIEMLDDAERELVVRRWNDTDLDMGPAATLPDLVEAQVARTPDAVAVAFEGRTLTYGELDARANDTAAALRDLGAGPGTVVAVCAERSLDLVAALLAVLKTGAAYLPLDPEYPADRLAFMLADTAPLALLTSAEVVATALDGTILDGTGPAGPLPVVLLDEVGGSGRAPARGRARRAGPDDDAYVIYTSGSTGRPKGVPTTHRAIHNRLEWMRRAYGVSAEDVILQKAPHGFDVSVWEFFLPLATGATLALARPGGQKDAAYLVEAIDTYGVTIVHFVPSMLSVFLAEDTDGRCGSLRLLLSGGEELPLHLAREVLERLGCELYNQYGPTEAAIDVTSWHCTPASIDGLARIPIGRPMANLRTYILDAARQPVPVGMPGHLHLAGTGVARGYLGRPELTAERFVADPFTPAGRMYATGDLARFRPDGCIEFLGRLDHQVKLRGLRIEPGEIESVLREQPGVRDAVVTVREDRPGDRRLVAYYVPSRGPGERDAAGVSDAGLRAALKAVLPIYMVPSSFVRIDEVPLTRHGKLDRAALPAPGLRTPAEGAVAPRDDLERVIAATWADVLATQVVGIDDDFFDLGGHSLLATQVVARLRAVLPDGAGPVTVMDFFKNPTVRQLAALVTIPATEREHHLLHELTPPVADGEPRATFVCVPYGGGSAVVYAPLADALPEGYSLFALAIPGHDVGLEEEHVAFDALVSGCAAEIVERVTGPVILYGHCGIGGAVAVAVAIALERAGREVTAVYTGAMFPFARPPGRFATLRTRLERLRSDRLYANWLTSLGIDLADLDPDQVRALMTAMRRDSEAAEDYFTELMGTRPDPLRAPVISVVGERDDTTFFYEERFREWHFLTSRTALVVLEEAGHYFLKYRADELAEIVTRTHEAVLAGDTSALPARGEPDGRGRGPASTWWLAGVSSCRGPVRAAGPEPSMRRFLTVATSQLVSMIGSAMTSFAVPVWLYLDTGSLLKLALFSTLSMMPGVVVLPLAGAVVDRFPRRTVMLVSDAVAAGVQAAFLALLLTGGLRLDYIFVLLVALSVATTFQRLAYTSAVPQLAPKRYLGHANGLVQVSNGVAQFLVPVAAVGVLATVGLEGILLFDVIGYAFAVLVTACTRFPTLMAFTRRETLLQEIVTGFRFVMRHSGFRAMLGYFTIMNIFLGPMVIFIQPLVLGFGSLTSVTQVSMAGGAGAAIGGLVMALWGGPVRRRVPGMLLWATAMSLGCLLAGLRPSVPVTVVGIFVMYLGLSVMNAIYMTIVQVKVPARYHGRVFGLNMLFTWGMLPIGFFCGALASPVLEDALAPGGPLAATVGRLVGSGSGRGIGLSYVLFATAILALTAAACGHRAFLGLDRTVPDAEADDLVGLRELRRRAGTVPEGATASRPSPAPGRE